MYQPGKAYLQGILLGLHAAHSFGAKHVRFNVPSSELLLQVQSMPVTRCIVQHLSQSLNRQKAPIYLQINDRTLPCGSDVDAMLGELEQLAKGFDTAVPHLHVVESGNQLMELAWQACTSPEEALKVCFVALGILQVCLTAEFSCSPSACQLANAKYLRSS